MKARLDQAFGYGRQVTQAWQREQQRTAELSRHLDEYQRNSQRQLVAREEQIAALQKQLATAQTQRAPQPTSAPQAQSNEGNWLDRELAKYGYGDSPQPTSAPPQPQAPQAPQYAQLPPEIQRELQEVRQWRDQQQRSEIRNRMEGMINRVASKYPNVMEPQRLRLRLLDTAIEYGDSEQALEIAASRYAMEEQALGARVVQDYLGHVAKQRGIDANSEELARLARFGLVPGQPAPAAASAPASASSAPRPGGMVQAPSVQAQLNAPPQAPRRSSEGASRLSQGAMNIDGLPGEPANLKDAGERALQHLLSGL
jgi:hypothetical protein